MIIVIGVSHRTAPLPVREALAFPKDQLRDALLRLRAETGAGEAMILSTCNRVELYTRQDDPGAVEASESFLARYHSRDGRELHAVVYRNSDSKLNSLSLRQHCASRLARTEMPSSIEMVTEPLPKTSTGKIDRKRVGPRQGED